MIEPVELQQMTLAALSAGAVVLFGACYALFLALSRLMQRPVLGRIALLSYLALAAFTLLLAWALNLSGGWSVLVVLLLVGYYFAPRVIWALSRETHKPEHQPSHRRSNP